MLLPCPSSGKIGYSKKHDVMHRHKLWHAIYALALRGKGSRHTAQLGSDTCTLLLALQLLKRVAMRGTSCVNDKLQFPHKLCGA